MADLAEVKNLIEQQGAAWEAWQKKQTARMDTVEKEVGEILKRSNRHAVVFGGGEQTLSRGVSPWIDPKTKQPILTLSHGQPLYRGEAASAPNIGRVLRGIVLGGNADDAKELAEERKDLEMVSDPAGGYTVRGALAERWIDLLRAQMVLSRAGVTTVPMDTAQLRIARLTSDPTAYWHGENADLTASDPNFGAVNLSAKTVVAVTKLSLELGQDSANIEQILTATLTRVLAQAIDSAGLVGVTTGAGAAPEGIFNLSGRNTVTSIGAPAAATAWDWLTNGMYELLADNVAMSDIGALIAHPKLWKTMVVLKDGQDQPINPPAEVAALPKLWTTAAPLTGGTTAKAAIGNWADYLFGVRKDIQVMVLRERFLADKLQVAVLAYARCDFAAARAASFCTLEGITVS